MIVYLLEWHWESDDGLSRGDEDRQYFGNRDDLETRLLELRFHYDTHLRAFVSRLTTRDDLTRKGLILECLNRRDYFSNTELELIQKGHETKVRHAKV